MSRKKSVTQLEHGTVSEVDGEKFLVTPHENQEERIICFFNTHRHVEAGDTCVRLGFVTQKRGTPVKKDDRVVFRRQASDVFRRPDRDEVYGDWAFETEYDALRRVLDIPDRSSRQLQIPGIP